jgi:hypothetical protein
MNNKKVHIVSFDIPYPPNYGGVIDVFYKIRALHQAGIGVILHCFEYHRPRAAELEAWCSEIHYYRRDTRLIKGLAIKPFIVNSRISEPLVERLCLDDHPVIFEGLHTCGILSDRRLEGRLLIYRESNIEHHYYMHLCRAERKWSRKAYFLAESIRLRFFQRILNHAKLILTVSETDTAYLKQRFPRVPVQYLPSFHPDNEVNPAPGKGNFVLYHGKLSVPENSKAALYIIGEVWDRSFPDLVVAGMDPPLWLRQAAANRPNIRIISNPPADEMARLVREAHVNLLVSFQATGLKLKLLSALYNGRFCLVTPQMVAGTPLAPCVEIAATTAELKQRITLLCGLEFTPEMAGQRKSILDFHYSNAKHCNMLMEFLHL